MGQGFWTIEPLPASTPLGAISMFAWNDEDGLSGLNSMGWFLCDGGTNATAAEHPLADRVPDMQNRFVKGGVLGQNIGVGGGSTQTDGSGLNAQQNASHGHNITSSQGSHSHSLRTIHVARETKTNNYNQYTTASGFTAHSFGSGFETTSDSSSGSISSSAGSSGAGEAHTHTYDPYHITVAYIIYLGKVAT